MESGRTLYCECSYNTTRYPLVVKIILHRIISVVCLTGFLPETWTNITHDDELRRPPLSVKRLETWEAVAFQVSRIEDRSLLSLFGW